MEFTLKGQRYDLDRRKVEDRMRDVAPELGRRHYVEIGGRRYPVKQVLGDVLSMTRLDFTTQDARNILKRLGFEVHEQ